MTTHTASRPARTLMTAYGMLAYAAFAVVFLYAIGWVEGLVVPRTIDDGPTAPATVAVLVDLALLSIFAVQHSVMARPGSNAAGHASFRRRSNAPPMSCSPPPHSPW